MAMSYLITMSPAKRFHEPPVTLPTVPATAPLFLSEADAMVRQLKKLDSSAIAKMMSLSDSLATLNHTRFQAYQENASTTDNVAAATFAGDAYQSLSFASLSPYEAKKAQECLFFLSGLYGLLKPYDYMQPYRLEMGCPTQSALGHSLYDFWLPRLAPALAHHARAIDAQYHFNLSSSEYGKSINREVLGVTNIDFIFATPKDAAYRIIGIKAKRARGLMARHLLTQTINTLDDVCAFNAGYRYAPEHSNQHTLVFLEQT